jgi:Holliday junction DNA helicase RuvA
MLAFLSGPVEAKPHNPNRCVLNVGGIGFSLFVSQRAWNDSVVGSSIKLFTSLNVSQDSVKIFGFAASWELDLFEVVSSVKGIGPRSALALVDGLSVRQLTQAIAEGSESSLTQVQGIGKKTAERIIFELKTKLTELERISFHSQGEGSQEGQTSALGKFVETENILRSLGYSQIEIEKAIQANSASVNEDNSEALLKACLTWLSTN